MATDVPDSLIRKLEELDEQHRGLDARLIEPEVLADHRQVRALSIKKAAIEPVVMDFRAWRQTLAQISELHEILTDGDDPEMAELARAEQAQLLDRAAALIDSVQRRLVRADDQSVGSVIVEIRAGVGGDEAGIWAGDLLEMYRRYAASRGWVVQELQASPSEMGGFKQVVVSIGGEGVWSQLAFEAGTHQVKRVPATEAQGRIHTSTATVAVLPEPEEIDVELDPADVKEMITTSQGPGGQNVNKVATAVHLIHHPSGLEVRMQDTKSQAQNREKAWQLLRARLYEQQRARAEAERAEARVNMIGTARRAEKIRTYRYKENIVVDHRLGESSSLAEVMAGNLQPLIDQLIDQETARRLASL